MLKKEALTFPVEDSHILLTVGYEVPLTFDLDHYGYRKDLSVGDNDLWAHGSVNRLPYWVNSKGEKLILHELDFEGYTFSTIMTLSGEFYQQTEIIALSPFGAADFLFTESSRYEGRDHNGDSLNLKDNCNRTIPIRFTPPPAGYL